MELTPVMIRVALLAVLLLPLLVGNVRTGRIKNVWLAVLLVTGVACALFLPTSGVPQLGLPQVGYWLAGMVLFLGMFATGGLAGGTAKFMVALIPWLALREYLVVLVAGGMLAILIAYALKRNAPIVPPIMAAALAVTALPLAGIALG